MGSLCSCFRAPEPDDESVDSVDSEQIHDSSGMADRNAQANFTSFLQNLTDKCEAVLGKRMEAVPWPYQGPSTSQPILPQSCSPGSSSSSSGSGISLLRHRKGSNHSRVEPEPVHVLKVEPSEEGSKKGQPEIPLMVALDKLKSKANTISEDAEDVCPICLEEYTSENPRIVTKCSHHYHLSCIYEWNERSETCPVCSKLMVFEEMD